MWYEVVHVPNLCEGNDRMAGLINHNKSVISIDSGMSTQAEHEVILHEALHSMLLQTRTELEDDRIDTLAYQLYGFIRENPKLIISIIKK